MVEHIYKILRPAEFKDAQNQASYIGSSADIRDGFIHFSCAEQLNGTANKHFSDAQTVYLLMFPVAMFSEADLRWETSRGGALFPHLYTPLDISQAVKTTLVERNTKQLFDFTPHIGA